MSSTTGKNIIDKEHYPTPVHSVEALLAQLVLRPTDTFLEPCRGEHRRIFDRIALPANQKSWAELSEDVDYLNTNFGKQDVIITNPPFSLTEEFLTKSMSELASDGTLVYLQRVNYLGAIKRVPFWTRIGFPEKLSVLVPRPKFNPDSKHGDSCEYAWFIWDKGNRFPNMAKGLSHTISGQLLK